MKKVISILSAILLFALSFTYTVSVTADEADDSFSRKADIISKLNIYNAEDENAPITLGEMVSALVSISGVDLGKAEKVYYDIELTDPMAAKITTAYHMGLISVPKDARLRPQRTVSYDETVKMAARVLGYGELIDSNYTAVLSKLKFTKHVNISDYSALTQGDAVSILYKMLDEEVVECSPDKAVAGTGKTVLESYLDIEKISGVVTATSVSSLDGSIPSAENKILIDGKGYPSTGIENTEDFLGCRVEGYLQENADGVISFLYFGKYKNEITVIDDVDIDSITASRIEYSKNGRDFHEDLSGTEDIIYNYVAAPYLDLPQLFKDKFDGYIELIDNDSDSKTDVIKVYSYRNYVVKAYNGDKRIVTQESKGILDYSDYTNVIFLKNDGTTPSAEDFVQNALISVFDSGNKEYAKIIVNSKNTIGYVTGKVVSDNTLFIDEDEYHTDKYFFETYDSKMKSSKITVLLDYRDKAAAICDEESQFGFKWGYLCNIYKEEGLDDNIISVKILDADGIMHTFELYKKVYLDGYKKDAAKVYEYFSGTDVSNGRQYCKRQFVRYAVNGNGALTDIDSPVQTEAENEDCNDAVEIEDRIIMTDDYTFFSKINYGIAKDITIFVIPEDASGNESDNELFPDSAYSICTGARTFFQRANLTIKLEIADLDDCNIAGFAAVKEIHYDTPPYGGTEVEKSNKMEEYMVEDIGVGVDEDGNICPMLRFYSQRDNNTVQKALADSENIFMKPVYNENGKVVSGQYKPLQRGDIVRLKYDYAGKKVIAVAVDFDIDRTDNGRFKQNTYYAIGVARAKSGVGLSVAYKTNAGAPEFDGHNADEVFDFTTYKNVKISSILANGYITVFDRKENKIYRGGYNDIIDYTISPDDLPIVVSRCRNNKELALFIIR